MSRQSRVENSRSASKLSATPDESSKLCPRCGMDDAHDVIDGRCGECRLAEEEADWTDEDEESGGSPWGK